MKTLNKISLFLLIPFLYLNAQSNFNIEDYRLFLQNNQNMSSQQLLDMHNAGIFVDKINQNYDEVLYFDSIDIKYNLTEYEKSLIQNYGFMVSERLSKISFGEALLQIYHQDLPVFVSTDAILHAFHISYDRILRDIELGILIEKVDNILNQMYAAMPQLHDQYSSNPEMVQMLKDVDVYLSVPRKLFNENAVAYYSENNPVVNDILTQIFNEQGHQPFTLFSETCRIMDWSQFKPRGHYVSDEFPILAKYFRVMMWLGRTELYLLKPSSLPVLCPAQTFVDIKRQTIDALLINELFELAGTQPIYDEVEDILQFFVGESDNVTLPNIQFMKNAVSITSASELLDSLKLVEFQDTLKNQSFAYQLILSQILYGGNPTVPDSIVPASAFMMFGQRFVIDSYVTGSVVYDRIFYNGSKICRLLPSTLDVLFSLGNDASVQLLTNELEQYYYSSNLAALRYLIDSYDQDFWESTLYNNWLGNIRSINPPQERNELPAFMQTAAYWQQKMNTQLASWAQLRHDNLLYAKQSYTGGTICSFPYSYVEPFPDLYLNLRTIADLGYNKFQTFNFSQPGLRNKILDYFNILRSVSDTLASIAQKELNNTALSIEETNFLKKMIYDQTVGSGSSPYQGWYADLFYSDFETLSQMGVSNPGLMDSDHIVADIHTVPTDCYGASVGWIPHVGTGPINLGVWLTELADGQLTAFIGPVLSYYEYTTSEFERLTDQEWNDTYLYLSLRPDWVNIYLADSTGNSRGEGGMLITSVEEDPNNPYVPQTHIIAKHYPNPFNPNVIINFSIPYDLTNSLTELIIYDVTGQKVKTLVRETLPSGNYLVKWNATKDDGIGVSSGVYLYVLKVAEQQVTGKMIYQK